MKGFTSDANSGELLLKGHKRKSGIVSIYIPARFGQPKLEEGVHAIISHVEPIAGGHRIDITVHGNYRVHVLGK